LYHQLPKTDEHGIAVMLTLLRRIGCGRTHLAKRLSGAICEYGAKRVLNSREGKRGVEGEKSGAEKRTKKHHERKYAKIKKKTTELI
jgi:hypothetical protein